MQLATLPVTRSQQEQWVATTTRSSELPSPIRLSHLLGIPVVAMLGEDTFGDGTQTLDSVLAPQLVAAPARCKLVGADALMDLCRAADRSSPSLTEAYTSNRLAQNVDPIYVGL